MRIAFISNYLPSGSKIGVGYQAHYLAEAMAARGHEVTMFTACPPVATARYRTVVLSLPRRLRTFAFAAAVGRLDLRSYDVVHAHGDDYLLLTRKPRVHVRTMHGSCFEEARRICGVKEKSRMVLLALSELVATAVADRTVMVSPQTRRWMPWVHDVVPNGVPRAFRPDPSRRASNPQVLFVGTYRNRKRGELLKAAFEGEVLPRVPAATLVMVCEDAPASPSVTVTGRVDEARLIELYQESWVFCLPSTYEGFGIPYAEALACGTPVVATPNPGADFVLGGRGCGVIVRPEHLGTVLAELLQNSTTRAELIRAALQRSAYFTMDSVADAYLGIYASEAQRAPSRQRRLRRVPRESDPSRGPYRSHPLIPRAMQKAAGVGHKRLLSPAAGALSSSTDPAPDSDK